MTKFIEVTCRKTGRQCLINIDAIRNVGGWEHAEIQIGESIFVEAVETYEEVRAIIDHVGQMIYNKDSWVH